MYMYTVLVCICTCVQEYLRGRVLIDVVVSEQPFIDDPCCPTSAVSIPSPLSQATGTKVTPAMGVAFNFL